MNPRLLKIKFWLSLCLAAWVSASGRESERIYSLDEVAVIDRENKLWRLVDAAKTVEANIQGLLAARFPAAEVEALKPRLVAMWAVDLGLRLDGVDQTTLAKIKELEPEYAIRLRRARVRALVVRLGGEHEPLTPVAIQGRWRSEIMRLLDDRELQEFTLMNAPSAVALDKLTKNITLTLDERRTLYRWKQDFVGEKLMLSSQSHFRGGELSAHLLEAQLDYWRQIRELLGDDRFAVFLKAADPGFERMAGELDRIGGVHAAQVLDLWEIRKKDEVENSLIPSGSSRYGRAIKLYESAAAILGAEALAIYEQSGDAKWLERNNPFQGGKAEKVAEVKASP